MSRNTHHRIRDHTGYDNDTNVLLNGAIGALADQTNLHTVLTSLYNDLTGMIVARTTGCEAVFDAGSGWLAANAAVMFEIPFNATITAVRLVTDQVGSITLDIWKDTWANFPPTVTDSICGSSKPTIVSGQVYENTSFTGWTTTSIPAGSWIIVHVDSVSSIKRATLSISLFMTYST